MDPTKVHPIMQHGAGSGVLTHHVVLPTRLTYDLDRSRGHHYTQGPRSLGVSFLELYPGVGYAPALRPTAEFTDNLKHVTLTDVNVDCCVARG